MIDPILVNLKSVSNDEEISMDDKIYDHTKTVDYCEDEDKVKKDKLNEMVLYKKRQQKIKDRQEKIIIKEKMKDELKKKKLVEKENKEKKNYLIKKRSYN